MICILHIKYVTRNIWNVYSTIYGCAEATMRTFFYIYKKEGTNYWKLNRNWNYLVHWTYATVSLFLLFYFWNSVFIMSNKSKHNRIEFTSVLPHHHRHHHHSIVTVAIDTNLSNSIDVDVSKPLNHPVSIHKQQKHQ